MNSVREKVAECLVKAGSSFREDQKEAWRRAIERETNEQSRWVMRQVLENALVAEKTRGPLCDDTGIPHLVLEIGEDCAVTGRMLDAISQNRKDTAFRLLNDMLRSGEPAMRILAVITGQLELMLEVRECLSAGMNQNAIPKAVGAHEFRVQKAAKFSSGYSEKELRRILVNAFETDVRIKSGILDEKLALEMLIAEI